MRRRQPLRQAVEFARLLERRIDQHYAATLNRRHVSCERGPAVDRDRLGARITGKLVFERVCRVRFELAGDQPVLPSQRRLRQRRRSWIGGELAVRIERRDGIEIGREQRADRSG